MGSASSGGGGNSSGQAASARIYPSPIAGGANPPPFCGNGMKERGEGCDDGNLQDGDGCSSSCRSENGEGCFENRECETALCVSGACAPCARDSDCGSGQCVNGQCVGQCGNGVIEGHEECDAADQNSDTLADHCRSDCRSPRCGDAVRDASEQCDDGNTDAADGCDSSCRQVQSAIVELPPPLGPFVGAMALPQEIEDRIRATATSRPPTAETGPVAIAIMAAGAASGWAFMRRRKR